MDFPIHIDTISMDLPIVYFEESKVEFSKLRCFLSMKDFLILANSADPNYAAFHLGLQCLPKYPFREFQYTKG